MQIIDRVMSTKIYTFVLQVIIVGVFVLIAAGSGTAGYATYSRPSHHKSYSSHSHHHEAPKQDLCQRNGYRYIGSYGQSESTCHHACRERGYRKSCRPTNPPSSKCYCI